MKFQKPKINSVKLYRVFYSKLCSLQLSTIIDVPTECKCTKNIEAVSNFISQHLLNPFNVKKNIYRLQSQEEVFLHKIGLQGETKRTQKCSHYES